MSYFVVTLTNTFTDLDEQFESLEAAREAGNKTGFEYSVMEMFSWDDGTLRGFYTIFGGWHPVGDYEKC
jgi:hypothetical protein